MLISALEKGLQKQGLVIAGVDEVGRGPLAGPVLAACVSLPVDFKLNNKLKEVDDSKKLSAKRREELYEIIIRGIKDIGIGICEPAEIDHLNIFHASLLAMKKAIGELKNTPDIVLVDGKFLIPQLDIRQQCIVKGDSLIFSIAAASIVGKVTRDRMMKENHKKYPLYGFDQNKGYGTRMHFEKIKQHGLTEIHRKSFTGSAGKLLVKMD
ncbi:MAG: Ribonuclease HII [Parcubacteria group bacterium GW2011_GWE2_39_37]|uniref:Ribonuclease HII n=1 Tax=Candidatus Falkowbacteria bacterium GW2011_GWF2_39_8 TaxID=1618642 RepID=A0A0G0Q8S5_9BACT|nr:MAG: Ribonuclease HII [Parcubacteria group bacterium GW2011_GWE2_39_37]KKR33716.1 MAG: Ribonuclease HII [Candidatus Falkowbacteria bacterium GW2011_GWF2_39_8]